MKMEWTRGITIGHGSSATVYLATCPHSSDVITAVKSAELSQSHPEQQLQLQREQRILSSLSSPYIVAYKGCNITKEHNKFLFNLFMEYMPFGTLSRVIRLGGYGRLDEPAIAHYTSQILQGLDYLHENGVVHCDIKGSNVLVCENGVKIGDFGCAKRVSDTDIDPFPITGTPMFMSPEVARGEEQGYPCDIWALGCTVIEMATGSAPWSNVDDPVTVLYRLAYSNDIPEIPSFMSEEGKDFLEKCFKRDPKERWSCSQLLKHPFVVELKSTSSVKEIQEIHSSSPTSILEQDFWSSVEDSECSFKSNLSETCFENCNSPDGRIKRLALCSRDPNWRLDDENWVTIRWNDEGASTSDELEKSDVSGRISGYFCEDCDFSRDVSVVVNSLNFERGIVRMLSPSKLDIL